MPQLTTITLLDAAAANVVYSPDLSSPTHVRLYADSTDGAVDMRELLHFDRVLPTSAKAARRSGGRVNVPFEKAQPDGSTKIVYGSCKIEFVFDPSLTMAERDEVYSRGASLAGNASFEDLIKNQAWFWS